MRDFGHSIGEDTEIYFSLYDAKRNQYLSERFLVRISKEGFSSFIEKIHSNCTIFTDLGNADLSRDLYMVAHVMRCGRMLYSDSGKNKAGTATYRRPHGVAVLSLAEATQDHTEELEMTFKVSCSKSIDLSDRFPCAETVHLHSCLSKVLWITKTFIKRKKCKS